jgi:hypothetical protein
VAQFFIKRRNSPSILLLLLLFTEQFMFVVAILISYSLMYVCVENVTVCSLLSSLSITNIADLTSGQSGMC